MARDLIIIGSGPAGYSAAVYAARASLKPLMFLGKEVGGQLTTTTDVENFVGFPDGVMGPELMDKMKKQAERFGTELVSEEVTKVDFSVRPFKVWAGERMEEAKSVIITTGASAKRLGLESEKALYGHGVSACATCDGFFFKDKDVVVVGGGDSAMEEGTFLTRFAKSVRILVRGSELKASKIMAERARSNPKISFEFDTSVTEVLGVEEGRVTGVKVKGPGDEERTIECQGVFAAIGHAPNTALFEGQLELGKGGYLVTKPGTSETSVEGVFAGGDVQDYRYRQAITAAGSGCMAALDAQHWLEKQAA